MACIQEQHDACSCVTRSFTREFPSTEVFEMKSFNIADCQRLVDRLLARAEQNASLERARQ